MNKLNKLEYGRSLVEMLGVLAVMGVLGITGISGYNLSINKHHANEIINSVSKMAISASGQFMTQNTFSLNEFNHRTENGYIASELIYGKEPIFGIRIKNLPKEICQKIIATHWSSPKEIAINGIVITEASKCTKNATIDFIFSKNLEPSTYEIKRCQNDSQCSGCTSCQNYVCTDGCATGKLCGKDIENAVQNTCCSQSNYLDGFCCRKIQGEYCLKNNGVGCPVGYFWGELNEQEGCYSCDENELIKITSLFLSSCHVCDNREAIFGQCVLPDYCGPGQILHRNNQCDACDSNQRLNISMGKGRTRAQSVRDCITNCADYNPNRKIACYRTIWDGTGCYCYPNGCPTGSSDVEEEGVCLSLPGYYYNYYNAGNFSKCPTNLSEIDNWQYCTDECHLVWNTNTNTCSFPTDISVMDYQWGCEAAGGIWSGDSDTNGKCLRK